MVALKMVDRIDPRMKDEPGVAYTRPPSRFVGLGDPEHPIFSEMPMPPAEEEVCTGMALAVGVTDDATIFAAAVQEPMYGDAPVLAAKAVASNPPTTHEEAVD